MRDNIMPLPYKEPSQVLLALLNQIIEEGRKFAGAVELQTSDMSAQAPVGTTLALLERQLKVMTAVSARLHFSFKQELKLLAGLIRDYTEDDYDYDPVDAPRKAKKSDYSHVEIIPVSDPNAATMSQRVVQYQAVIQMAQMAPDIYDLPKLHRGMLEVLGIKNAAELVPLEDDQKPKDPVSENMAALKGEPLKAFQYQDHESHIKVHTSAMQDPIVMQLIGQNPKAPQIQAAMTAHIAEHVGFAYRQKIEQRLGMPLPPQDEKLPPEIELQLSAMMAEAAQQVLQQSQQQAAQQQAQQQQQDPLIQMQQQELQIRTQEVQIKMQEAQLKEKQMAIDAAARADELELKREELTTRMQLEGTKVAAKMRYDTERLAAEPQRDGARMGVDIAKSRDQIAAQRAQQRMQQQQKEKPTK